MRRNILTCRSGATAIEYGLICALIFLAIIGGMSMLGDESSGLFGGTRDEVTRVMN